LGLKYANIENFEWNVSFVAILKATNFELVETETASQKKKKTLEKMGNLEVTKSLFVHVSEISMKKKE
jgi:hypothetical protein